MGESVSEKKIKPQHVDLPPDTDPKVLGIFTRDRTFYRTFFPLLVIISLQQLAVLAVSVVDNVMLGMYTELSLTGATLVNQIQFLLHSILQGMGLGTVVLASQYWGKKEINPIKKIISLALKFGFFTGLAFFVVCKFFPIPILSLFTNDPTVIAEAARYLNVVCWTYLLFGISYSLMYALQSVETVTIGTVMALSTVCINACLNYIFIFGNFGAPELGIVGAATATVVSRSVEVIIIFVYLLKVDKKLRMRFFEFLRFDGTYLRDYLHVATPMLISNGLWGFSMAAQTALLGHISANVLAAASIASVISQIFTCVGFTACDASAVVIGKTIGEQRFDMLRSYCKTLQGIYIITGVVFAALLYVFIHPICGLYSISAETYALTVSFLLILCVTNIGSCYEAPLSYGIVAGGGVTMYAAVVDNLFMWLFTIPLAYLSAFVFGWSPIVTYMCLKADQILKCIPNSIVVNRYKWVRVLTREVDETRKPAQ